MRLAVLMAAALVAQQLPPRDAARPGVGTASIAGVVMDAARRAPVINARVELGAEERITYSNDKGEFVFPDIPAGSYRLAATAPGYVGGILGATPVRPAGSLLAVADGEHLTGVRLDLHHGGVVSGRVTGPDGAPMAEVRVEALALRWRSDGTREFDTGKVTTTDDRGEYRLFNLGEQRYVVSAIAKPVASYGARERALQLDGIQPLAGAGYVRSFFPGVTDPAAAAPLDVAWDSLRDGVDFQLHPEPLAAVRGRVTPPPTSPSTPARDGRSGAAYIRLAPSYAIDGAVLGEQSDMVRASPVGPDGRFVIDAVPPGQYRIDYVTDAVQAMFGSTSVTVSGRDVSDVEIAARPGVTVAGTEVLSSAPDGGPTFQMITLASLDRPHDGLLIAREPSASGRFSIAGVRPGRYVIGHLSGGVDWYISAVASGNAPLVGRLLDVGAEDVPDVRITFHRDRPVLTGTVRRQDQSPVTDATLIAFPEDKKQWPTWMTGTFAAQPDSRGAYRMPLLPGTYLVAAVTSVRPYQWMDPAFLEPLVPGALRVVVAAGQTVARDFLIK